MGGSGLSEAVPAGWAEREKSEPRIPETRLAPLFEISGARLRVDEISGYRRMVTVPIKVMPSR